VTSASTKVAAPSPTLRAGLLRPLAKLTSFRRVLFYPFLHVILVQYVADPTAIVLGVFHVVGKPSARWVSELTSG